MFEKSNINILLRYIYLGSLLLKLLGTKLARKLVCFVLRKELLNFSEMALCSLYSYITLRCPALCPNFVTLTLTLFLLYPTRRPSHESDHTCAMAWQQYPCLCGSGLQHQAVEGLICLSAQIISIGSQYEGHEVLDDVFQQITNKQCHHLQRNRLVTLKLLVQGADSHNHLCY